MLISRACAIASMIVLLAASCAIAAPTATYDAGTKTLTVTGEAVGETFTVSTNGGYIEVAGPAGMPDPDGGGNTCNAPTSTTVACQAYLVAVAYVNAGDGNDTLTLARTPGHEEFLLDGQGGDDTLSYQGAADSLGGTGSLLTGGPGDDTLTRNRPGIFGFVHLEGGDGRDTLNAGNGGLERDDGGPGDDVFNGGAQDRDFFITEPGADTYHGGTRVPATNEIVDDPATYQTNSIAADSIDYRPAMSALNITFDDQPNDGATDEHDNVGSDIEWVFSGPGNDVLTAGANAVFIDGGEGEDVINGGPIADEFNGGAGNDLINGNGGNDILRDGDTTPAIVGPMSPPQPTPGNDKLVGGPGGDRFITDAGADELIGGGGADTGEFTRPFTQLSSVTTPVAGRGFEISLDDVANDGVRGAGEGDNVHSDIETINTGDGCNSGCWRSGDDMITGSPAAQTIITNNGNDTVDPGPGTDTVDTGRGDDVVSSVDANTDRVACGDGNDSATVDLPGAQPDRADIVFDCETVTGTPFPAPPGSGGTSTTTTVPRPLTLTVSAKTISSRTFLKSGVLTVSVSCDQPCSVEGEALTNKARLAKVGDLAVGSGKLGLAGGKRSLQVRVAKRYLRSYKRKLRTKAQRRRGVAFTVRVTARTAAGLTSSARKTLKVRG